MYLTKPAAVALQIIGGIILIVSLIVLLVTGKWIATAGFIGGIVVMIMGRPKKKEVGIAVSISD